MGYLGTKPSNSPLTSELIPNSIITNAKINDVATTKLTGQVPDANAPSGSVIQVVYGVMSSDMGTSSTSYVDSGASATITPQSASNKILVLVSGQYAAYSVGVEGRGNFRILRNSTTLREGLSFGWYFAPDMTSDGNTYGSLAYSELDSPNSTSAITYKVQVAIVSGANIMNLNRVSVTLMEIAA